MALKKWVLGVTAAMAAFAPSAASAAVQITEFMYQGTSSGAREYFELTNIATTSVSVAGWSYNDDNPNAPVSFGNFFGTLGANESVILTELTAEAFRSYWSLDNSVRIFSIGGSSNLGNADTINIYNSATQNVSTLVDSVTYSGTTAGISRNRPNATGTVGNALFVNSSVGDVYGSAYAAGAGTSDLGNPGEYAFGATAAAVPEPASWAMMIGGFGVVGAGMRRRRAVTTAARA
ncbi:PEPxxWA-CTERM sorting domain-containing protein [Sphingomonas sp. BIUV-7]|uniref:PEPxxWA-CTERM sorting domain-containing protein n=1 Tax=Sphingomonas natans TaxID=3063330 RepID=A0ABT8Y4G1_9SPHN|nr:PEPxxWA-CTERM sorting domain-containing protein [Sphingomonas sp. BIUV-7]MDO6413206.1 PEPxxWA-CTERM sorting domain-containing protein [Sphingomonas sp. BIUV-7]